MKKIPDDLPKFLQDIAQLTMTELKAAYPSEYSSWKNMKRRCTQSPEENTLSEAFQSFRSFLAMMGPKPDASHTIDRIDFTDPEYAEGKCRWADKATQTENRKSTVFITHAGACRSLAGWAELTQQNPTTLRTRYNKGWSHDEVVCGRDQRPTTQIGNRRQRQSNSMRAARISEKPTKQEIAALRKYLVASKRRDQRGIQNTWTEERIVLEQAKREFLRLNREYNELRHMLFHIRLADDLEEQPDPETKAYFDRYNMQYDALAHRARDMGSDRKLVITNLRKIAEKTDDLELWDFLYPQDVDGPDED